MSQYYTNRIIIDIITQFPFNFSKYYKRYMFDQPNLEKIAQADSYQLLMQEELQGPDQNTALGHLFREQIKGMIKHRYKPEMFDQLAKKTKSSDPLTQHEGIIGIKKLLSYEENPSILQNVNVRDHVKTHLIDKCLQLIRQNQYLHLKYQACHTLTNLAVDREFCELIVAKNGVPLLIALTKEQNQIIIQDLAVWALGNIAGDSTTHRDAVLQNGGARVLIEKIKKATTRAQVTEALWAISNICRTEPFTAFQEINEVCQILCEVLKSSLFDEDGDDFSRTLWTIYKLIEEDRDQIQIVKKSGILNMLLQYVVVNKSKPFCVMALAIIGIFSTGNEVQVEELVSNKLFFQAALALTSHPDSVIRQKICRIFSNIAERGGKLALALFSQQALLKNLSQLLWSENQLIIYLVCWIYASLARNPPQPKIRLIQLILSQKIPQAIARLLQSEQISIIRDSLKILKTVLKFGDQCQINGQNSIQARFLQRTAVSDLLNGLVNHQDGDVSRYAVRIIQLYFTELPGR